MSRCEVDVIKPKYASRVVIVPPLLPNSFDGGEMHFDEMALNNLEIPLIRTDAGDMTIDPASGVLDVMADVVATGDVYCANVHMAGTHVSLPGDLFFNLGPGGQVVFDGVLEGPNVLLTSDTPTMTTNSGSMVLEGPITFVKSPTVNCVVDVLPNGDVDVSTTNQATGKLKFNGAEVYPFPPFVLSGPEVTLTSGLAKISTEQSGLTIESFDGSMTLYKSPTISARFDMDNTGDLTITTNNPDHGKLMMNGVSVFPYNVPTSLMWPILTLTGNTPTIRSNSAGIRLESFDGIVTLVKSGGLTTTTIATDYGTMTILPATNEVHVETTAFVDDVYSTSGGPLNLRSSTTIIYVQASTGTSVNIKAPGKEMRFKGLKTILQPRVQWSTAGFHPPESDGVFLDQYGNFVFEPSADNTKSWNVVSSTGSNIFSVQNNIQASATRCVSVFCTENTYSSSDGAFHCDGGMSCVMNCGVGGAALSEGDIMFKSSVAMRNAKMDMDVSGNFAIQNWSLAGPGHTRLTPAPTVPNSKITIESAATITGNLTFTAASKGIQFPGTTDVLCHYWKTIKITFRLFGITQWINPWFYAYFSRIGNRVFMSWDNYVASKDTVFNQDYVLFYSDKMPQHFKPSKTVKLPIDVFDGNVRGSERGTLGIWDDGSGFIGPYWDYSPELGPGASHVNINTGEIETTAAEMVDGPKLWDPICVLQPVSLGWMAGCVSYIVDEL